MLHARRAAIDGDTNGGGAAVDDDDDDDDAVGYPHPPPNHAQEKIRREAGILT